MKALILFALLVGLSACQQYEPRATGEASESSVYSTDVSTFDGSITETVKSVVQNEDVDSLSDEEIIERAIQRAEKVQEQLQSDLENATTEEEAEFYEEALQNHAKVLNDLKTNEELQKKIVEMVRNAPRTKEEFVAKICDHIKELSDSIEADDREMLGRDLQKCTDGKLPGPGGIDSLTPGKRINDEGFVAPDNSTPKGPIKLGDGNFPEGLCEILKKDLESGRVPSAFQAQMKKDFDENCSE